MTEKLTMVPLYDWNYESSEIDSQYGTISILKWMTLEAERINSDPMRKAEIHRRGSLVRLLVDDVAEQTDGEEDKT